MLEENNIDDKKELAAEVKGIRYLLKSRLKQYEEWQKLKFNVLTQAKIEELAVIDGFFKAVVMCKKRAKDLDLEVDDEEI